MTISKIVEATLVDSTGIIDNTGTYSPSMRKFTKGQELINKEGDISIYKRAGDEITIPDYDSDKTDYELYDLVWKDGKTQWVTNTSGVEIKQPEEYDDTDTSYNASDWGERYMKLSDMVTRDDGNFDFNFLVKLQKDGDDTYLIAHKDTADTDKITWITGRLIKDDTEYGDDDFYVKTSDTTFHWIDGDGESRTTLGFIEDTDSLAVGDLFFIYNTEVETQTELEKKDYGYVIEISDEIEDGRYKYYVYVIEDSDTSHKIYYRDGAAYALITSVDGTTPKTEVHSDFNFYPKHMIKRGDDLYIRTNIDVDIEYKDVDDVVFKELESIDEIPWDWVFYKPTQEYAPFDNKKYTYLEGASDVTYTVLSNSSFDVVALNGLIASKVTVEVYNSDGNTVEVKSVIPKCKSKLSGKYKVSQGIAIVYLLDTYPEDTKIKITITTLDGYLRVGGGYLGDKVVVGFTNLNFNNKCKNFGFFEQDKFGNIVTAEGAKIRIFTGSADIELVNYDDVFSALLDVIDKKVIIDGTDNFSNTTPDSMAFFQSTMMIGRTRSIDQKTVLRNSSLSEMATYNFTFEEDI